MIRLRDWIDVRGVLQEASLRKVAVGQQERTLMNFLITTIGTAGDVLPFVELALALKKRGHHVEFASAEAYRSLVRTAGLPFHTLYAAPQARDIYSPIQGIRVASEERLIPALRPAYELISQLSPAEWILLSDPYSYGARLAQERDGFRLITFVVSPFVLRSVHEMPVMPGVPMPSWAPLVYRRLVLQIGARLWDNALSGPVNSFRKELGLTSVRDIWYGWSLSPQRVIGFFPNWFAPMQRDWPKQFVHGGFATHNPGQELQLPKELRNSTIPLVIFTAGSAGPAAVTFFNAAVEACRHEPWHGVLLTGEYRLPIGALPPNVTRFDYVPLGILLRHGVGAIVHHGGLGSISVALEHGTPQVAVPHGADQFYNAARIARLGVGRVIQLDGPLARDMKDAIQTCLYDEALQQKCRDLAPGATPEASIPRICNQIERDIAHVHCWCSQPGSLDSASDRVRVPCHVSGFDNDAFTVWRCTGCASLHSDEPVALASYYANYPVHQHRLDFPVRVAYSRRLAHLRRHGLRITDTILDYGCGNGVFVEFLKSKGYQESTGFDRFVKAFSNPAILTRSFDAVVSFDVLEHVEDPREFMREMVSLLKPGGLLVLGTPNADAVSLERRPFDMELSQPFHRHILSTKLLLALGHEEGMMFEDLVCRSPFDTLFPGLNTAFMSALIAARGGLLDATAQPIGLTEFLRHPKLLFFAFFGYFAASSRNVVAVFKKPSEVTIDPPSEDKDSGRAPNLNRMWKRSLPTG